MRYFSERWEYLQTCYESSRAHWGVLVAGLIVAIYSLWTNLEGIVALPTITLPRLPISWALVVVLALALFVAIEGGYRLSGSLPDSRPVIVPVAFVKDAKNGGLGISGVQVCNDGKAVGYEVELLPSCLPDGTILSADTEIGRIPVGADKYLFPVFLEKSGLPGYSGDQLYPTMVRQSVKSVTFEIRYRDDDERWYQTDIILERDVNVTGGLQPKWKQTRTKQPRK
jgi:hypothetical protein